MRQGELVGSAFANRDIRVKAGIDLRSSTCQSTIQYYIIGIVSGELASDERVGGSC